MSAFDITRYHIGTSPFFVEVRYYAEFGGHATAKLMADDGSAWGRCLNAEDDPEEVRAALRVAGISDSDLESGQVALEDLAVACYTVGKPWPFGPDRRPVGV